MNLTLQTVVVASKDQLASNLAGETVILGLSKGRYYGVDAVGARVWQLIQTPSSIGAVRDTIVAEYDVTPEQCEADLLTLFGRMREEGLVEVPTASDP
jgi:hypothetical protein